MEINISISIGIIRSIHMHVIFMYITCACLKRAFMCNTSVCNLGSLLIGLHLNANVQPEACKITWMEK